MSSCTKPEIGQMIGHYEFDLLDAEEKEQFEMHLLECDACYQDLYEFSPAVETIKANIKDFQNAAIPDRSLAKWLAEKWLGVAETARKFFWEPFPALLRPAIPVLAMAVIVLLVIQIARINKQPVDLANKGKSTQQKIVLQEPEEMESKGMGETKSLPDSGTQRLPISDFEKRLAASITVVTSEDGEYLIFSWLKVDSLRNVNIFLIAGEKRIQITPKEGISGNNIRYSAKNFNKAASYWVELAGETASGRKFTVKKKFEVEK